MIPILNLLDLCRGHSVFIQTHNFPDPDAITSAYGLQVLLRNFEIESIICYDGQIDKLSSLKVLSSCKITVYPIEEIQDRLTHDSMIILVDCQKNGGNTTNMTGRELACIDHHPTVEEIEYKYFDLRITGACASIISSYYQSLEIEPDRYVATALLYGLRMDTLQLSRGVTQFDLSAYTFLFDYADAKKLRKLENNNLEFSDLRAYGTAIENVRVFGCVGYSMVDFKCPDALVASISDFILSLVEVEVAVVFAKRSGGYKFSVRSERSDVHAGNLVHDALLGLGTGGGHSGMAGGFIEKELLTPNGENPEDKVLELFQKVIREKYPEVYLECEVK